LHHPLPVAGRINAGVLRFRADGSGVEQQLGALQGHGARALGKPLVPANADTHARVAGVPHLEAGVAGCEIVFFVVARTIGDVRLAIAAQQRAVGVQHGHCVVEHLPGAFKKADRQHHFQLGGQATECGHGRVALQWLRQCKVRAVLLGAEVRQLKQLRQQHHLRALLCCSTDLRGGMRHVGGTVPATACHLHQSDRQRVHHRVT